MGAPRLELADLDAVPAVGWVREPSPVEALSLGAALGVEALTVKRDDRLAGLHGGTKVRKLDWILASPTFRDAPRWASTGATGSSHLAACAAAAAELGAGLDAYVFLEPITDGVLENLACTSRASTRFHVFGSRAELALRCPGIFGEALDGVPVLPFGGSSPAGVAAIARAGLELADQIRSGALEPPDAVYCALGSGGLAAGLALGLGLAGLRAEVRAVAVVERALSTGLRLSRLIASARAWLAARGLPAADVGPAPLRVVRGHVGPGYGIPTARALAATEVLRREGLPAEPVYAGKAFGALLADAERGRLPRRVLYWHSPHRGSIPCELGWRAHLGPRLEAWLARAGEPPRGRRRFLAALGAASVAAVGAARVTGYPPLPGWAGGALAPWEAHVLAAAAEVLTGVPGVDPYRVAENVDRFVQTMPPDKRLEIHELLALVEHGTTPLGLRLSRFTRLGPDARDAFLASLRARGGLLADAYRGLRDLVLLGAYQEPASWAALGYRGPWVDAKDPALAGDELTAPPGARLRAAGPA